MFGPRVKVSRLDECTFAILLEHAGIDACLRIAQKVRADLTGMLLVRRSTGERLGRIAIGVGLAQYAEGEASPDLVRRAEACLALACRLGRNAIIPESDPRFMNADIDAA
jgi:diguanylate cyclase